MRYIGFWEIEPKEIYDCFEADDKIGEEYRSDPARCQEKYGKFLGAYFLEIEQKGFGLFEFDRPEQMINTERAYWPYKRWKFVPLLETGKVKEIYKKKRNET